MAAFGTPAEITRLAHSGTLEEVRDALEDLDDDIRDENWEYQRSVLLPQAPTSSILANGQIYTSNSNIIKYDKYLNITAHSNDFSGYRGLYFNSTNGLIYSGDYSRNKIKIFNQSLSLVNSFNLTFPPCSITEHNQMIVITDQTSGFINFYQNNIFIL